MTKEPPMSDADCQGKKEADCNTPALSPEVQNSLGTRIRAAYGELVRAPLPDKFQKLLDQLAQSEKKRDD